MCVSVREPAFLCNPFLLSIPFPPLIRFVSSPSQVECNDILDEAMSLSAADFSTASPVPMANNVSGVPSNTVDIPPLCCDPWVRRSS